MIISEIIECAYQESGVKALGVLPTAVEVKYALTRLNSIVSMLFGNKISTNVIDWAVSPTRSAPLTTENQALPFPKGDTDEANVVSTSHVLNTSETRKYIPVNCRMVCDIEYETNVWLHESPHDGAKVSFVALKQTADFIINANGRKIEGHDEIFIPYIGDNSPRTWFYRADLADWILLKPLVETDTSPLPSDFDDLLICALAIRLSAVNGQEPRSGTLKQYDELLRMLENRYMSVQTSARNGSDIMTTTIPTRHSFMDI